MNDDADGGRRGHRAVPSPLLLQFLQEQYGLDVDDVRDIGGGLNLNLAFGDRYVARVYRPYVTRRRLTDIQAVRRQAVDSGIPCARTLPARDGRSLIRCGANLVEVEDYIEHDGRMNTHDRLLEGMPLLARLHSVMKSIAVSPEGRISRYANYIRPQDARAGVDKAVTRIRSWNPTGADLALAAQASELADLVWEHERDRDVPHQLVHGDFWDNNVFFRGADIVAVADFDFLGERARIDDVALTLYFADLQQPLRGPETRFVFLRELLEAYDSGLEEPLTGAERAALPWALARQPLWEIGGWVASLDSEAAARRHLDGMPESLERALLIARDPRLCDFSS